MAVDHNNPQSRDEEILIATIDGNEYDKPPQSRMEELLLELKETIEEGGGGGTTNYNDLSNKPQINGHTLSGDSTGADLDLVDAEDGKGLSTNDYDDTEKAAVAAATSAISAMKDGSELDSFGDVEVALLDKADTSDLGTAAAKDSTNAVTSGSTDLVESGAVKDAIDSAVAAAYHHAGTKTVAQLTHDLLIEANEGNVYNITDSGTTTSDFIEGIGKTIDEGSNVGICKVGNVYMFDLLSGFLDTTNFVQKSQTAGLLNNDGTVNDEIEGDVESLKIGLTNLDNEVNGDATYPYADVITIPDAVPSNLAKCNVKIEPVQSGSGDPSPTNIRPITGHTETSVQRDGKNICNPDNLGHYIRDNATGEKITTLATAVSTTDIVGVKGNTTYVISRNSVMSTGIRVYYYDTNGDYISTEEANPFTTPINAGYIAFQNGNQNGDTTLWQIEEGSTATPYEPYAGKTYTIALGDTIYGGTVDFDSGVMTVDRKYAKGFTRGSQDSSNKLYSLGTIADIKSVSSITEVADFISNMYDVDSVANIRDASVTPKKLAQYQNTLYIGGYVGDETALDALLPDLEICYELATPITIQLTPQQIQLLKGTNTIYASTGDISVTVNGVSGAIGAVQEQVNELDSDKQDKTDNALTTTAKTVVGGINELKSGLVNNENDLFNVVGWCENKNLWDGMYMSDGFAGSYTWSSTYNKIGNTSTLVKEGCRYVASVNGVQKQIRYVFKDKNRSNIGSLATANYTEPAPSNAVYLEWRTIDAVTASDTGQIEIGIESTSYVTHRTIIGTAVNKLLTKVPDAPSTDGTYNLQVTVADGTPTYSWESAT